MLNKSYAVTIDDARVPEVLFTQSRAGDLRRKEKKNDFSKILI